MLPVVIAIVLVVITLLVLKRKKIPPRSHSGPIALRADVFQPFKLVEKIRVNHNSFIFRFALNSPDQRLGLPVGQHVYLRVESKHNSSGEAQPVQHAYTPISSDDEKGFVDFLVKVYYKGVDPKFPHGGRLSQHLDDLAIGDVVEMRGPIGKFEYLGNGNFTVDMGKAGKMRRHTNGFAMVAGGTGITPMMQIIRAILKSPEDPTRIWLVFANRTEEDILMREELTRYSEDPRVNVWYTLSREHQPGWEYSTGYVNEEMLRAHLPTPHFIETDKKREEHIFALICGPLPMLQDAVKPNLIKLGYSPEDTFVF
ncbi:Oxidoreductase FAD binding domain [Trypanosoma vivax]|uniref:NADH-cytochrome b5 reductase n=1 Tax=Trypanosoma vivax (strain Y486) TaxID=1055687 RepID=G0UAS6_TRYVY|nr:putative NADH-cytochrome b5 reductase [Trypanosoma vivax]KAH8611140.1 Oxidoreductase FAD binding domain [Trypanosoma vivax]CCC52912.1 putative NADH-cytochrome b5 reductase [Trypanosoma vivax Y486]